MRASTSRVARGLLVNPIVPLISRLGPNSFIRNLAHKFTGSLSMKERADSGFEIRRILLLTKLRESPKGMTMNQLVKDCSKIDGWSIAGTTPWGSVQHAIQSLINEGLVSVKTRFLITAKGRGYLEDPLQWHLNVETTEEVERKLFWNNIYEVFDKALARLKSKSQSTV
jgi:hypothetical protein